MYVPSFDQFLKDYKDYKTIPITYQLYVDTFTPIEIFHAFQDEASFILESHDDQSSWSNFSFIGLNPMYFIRDQYETFILYNKENHEVIKHQRLSQLFQELNRRLKVKRPNVHIPFTGGAVGQIGYDAISLFEKVPQHRKLNDQDSNCELVICQTLIAYDHHQKQITFIHYVPLTGDETIKELNNAYQQALQEISRYQKMLKIAAPLGKQFIPAFNKEVSFKGVQSNYTKERFIDDVKKIKEYIRRGDIFQAVLSQRFETEVTVSGFQLYRILRIINPSPYMFYIKFSNQELIGSSPERLIHIKNGHLEIHPIAGTRRRGKNEEEDRLLGENLLQDEKELAEHYMLVDLARNDIGRVAEYGSVQTPVLVELTYFSHVMHLISKVTGQLKNDIHPIDALISAFPAGTVSGAPKIRAMQILNELEPTPRQSYAGCIAYIGFDGNIDSCITIRTISLKENKAYVQAGAGIVADSVPELEWKETRNKASALIQTIQLAEQSFSKEELEDARSIKKMY
ncbi:anthranilate synthase component I [Aeribacillus alveayuensis]|uniref:Anthranilate synthase component 1 n=1 Tax=Aeribacillus alveayuensis TaxID=279215 RepID=A0ABT9VL01_9BACI|nr:anthranilate synthase component 1 [Bacillus alveayuensis]